MKVEIQHTVYDVSPFLYIQIQFRKMQCIYLVGLAPPRISAYAQIQVQQL
jgi:hypothetical protein